MSFVGQAPDKEVHKNVVVRHSVSPVVLNALHYERVAHDSGDQVLNALLYEHVDHESGDQARDKEDHKHMVAPHTVSRQTAQK